MRLDRTTGWRAVLALFVLMLAAAMTPLAAQERPEFTGERLVEWSGRTRDLQFRRRHAVYYDAEEFTFTLQSPAHGEWRVVSRETTPFQGYRMGPTWTGLKVDWAANPEVRIVGLKGIDRIPPTYPGLELNPAKTVTALLLDVKTPEGWKPWYVNNWFHKWSTPAEDARIAGHYVGKPKPYDVYGFRGDLLPELTPRSKEIAAKFPDWRLYHGSLVPGATAPNGYALEIRHLFQKNPATGGNDCVYGDPKELMTLEQLSPVEKVAGTRQESRAPAAAKAGWWMAGGGPEHRGLAAEVVAPPLKLRWEVKGGQAFAGAPTVVDGRVYLGNNDFHVYCYEAASGKLLWKSPTQSWVEATPTVWNGLVLIGSFDGHVYALDAATGKESWRFKTGPRLPGFTGIDDVKQGVDSSIAVVDGRAYFGGWDGKVYCLEAATGKPVWSHQTAGLVHWSSPAVSGGRVVIGTTDGILHCLSAADGKLAWTRKLAEPHSDAMMSGPTVADGTIYTGGGYEKGIYALALSDGAVRWQYTAKALVCSSPAVDDTRAYVLVDGAGQVVALDRQTGKELWSRSFGSGWGAANPVLSGSALYVTMRQGTEDGKPVALVGLDAATGRTLWSWGEGPAWAGVAVAGGMLFYGSDDGKLRAFGP